MSEWQPIETAPKDGNEILLWVVDLGARPAFWENDVWCSPVDGHTMYGNGEVSHWMPLPEPPQS